MYEQGGKIVDFPVFDPPRGYVVWAMELIASDSVSEGFVWNISRTLISSAGTLASMSDCTVAYCGTIPTRQFFVDVLNHQEEPPPKGWENYNSRNGL